MDNCHMMLLTDQNLHRKAIFILGTFILRIAVTFLKSSTHNNQLIMPLAANAQGA